MIPYSDLTEDERREKAREGGVASGEARRRKRSLQEVANLFLDQKVPIHIFKTNAQKRDLLEIASLAGVTNPEELTNDLLLVGAQFNKAIKGSPFGYSAFRDTLGEKALPLIAPGGITVNIGDGLKPEQRLANDIMDFCAKAGKPCHIYAKERYICVEGGRGSGKSEDYGARFVILRALTTKNGVILCGREIQKSLDDSVKPLLEDIITKYELHALFKITDNEILCHPTGTTIRFLGMKEATRTMTMKSMYNVVLVWLEEAQSTSQKTIDKLDPTIRRENIEMTDGRIISSQILMTYNRELESDPVHTYFVESKMPDVLHIHIDYDDNPFCPDTIKVQAAAMKATNYPKYLHEFKGEPETSFEDSLWPGELLAKIATNESFDRKNYSRVVVSCDPAQTDNEFSNEYGIGVEGMTFGNIGHVIADLSKKTTPNGFAQTVVDAFYTYQADCVVVEVNAGGDFIKSTILSLDPKIPVKEVRAHRDKVMRAVPVANLAQMGRIKHICGGFPKLQSQMSRMTTQGFKGAPGESPDRVDQMTWGFYELFGLTEKDTTETVFKSSMFVTPADFTLEMADVAYVGFDGDLFGLFICDVISEPDKKIKYLVKDYEKGRKEEVRATLTKLMEDHKVKELNIPDDTTGAPIINDFSALWPGVKAIDAAAYIKKPLVERVVQIIPYIADGQIRVVAKLPEKAYHNQQGDLFLRELCEYNPEQQIDRPLLAAVANCLFLENDMTGE